MKTPDKWELIPATKHVAELSCWGDFVISHWIECNPDYFIVSLRPPGEHIHIGKYPTLERAREAADSVNILNLAYSGKVSQL